MGRFLTIILISTGVLTLINIKLITYFPSNSFVYLIIFLLNIISLLMLSQFYANKEKSLKEENRRDISEKSIGIFIRIFVYFSPIIALFGLYIISLMNGTKKLGINDANDWVSFILGIASFVMALVSMWQSEGTYNRIFDGLDKLTKTTDDIKRSTDIMDALKTNAIDIGLKQNSSNDVNTEQEIIPHQSQEPEPEPEAEIDRMKELIKLQPFKIKQQ